MKRESPSSECPSASASPLSKDAPDPLQGGDIMLNNLDTFLIPTGPSTPLPDVSSLTFSPPNLSEPAAITPDEATELLRVLESSTLLEASSPSFQDGKLSISAGKSPPMRKKPGRKKSTGPRTGKMRNPSRERLQSELAYLRSKTAELEGQLKCLEGRRRSDRALKDRDSSNISAEARVWRRIAERQAEGRDRSERENKRLKGVLEGQIQLARRLEAMLKKNPEVTMKVEENPLMRLGEEDKSGMYELFLCELDGLYAQMDSVFQQTGLDTNVDDSFRHAYVKTRRGLDDEDELYAELQDVTIIPFALERATTAMWHAVRRQYIKNSYHRFQGGMERPDDTIAVKYRKQCHRNGQTVCVDAILVMRRYVERERLAFVWRSVSRAGGELSGMYTDETGWSVLKRIPPESGLNLSGCVMHNCVHVLPKRVDCSHQDEVGLLAKLVIDSYEDDVVALSAMMEDMLLPDN